MSVRQVSKLLQMQKNGLLRRSAATGENARQPHPLADKFKKFQIDDGVPVYLKAGFRDRVLFQFTVVLCLIGLANGITTLYSMVYKEKK